MLQPLNTRAICHPAAALWLVASVVACSSSPATGPTGGTGPASLTISSGAGQTAPPGTALPVRPAVLVKDASGAPLPGVTVAFAVDSGGGSLSAASATTGADGVATAGVWTLGPAEGRNTLKVTAGTLAPVMIGALAALAAGSFPTVTIGPGGGSVVVSQPGALNGFKLDIPAGAFAGSMQATLSYGSNASFPHIAGATPVSPIITISGATPAYAAIPMTLHIPAIIPANTFPVIVMFDSASGAREVLTTVAWDAAGVSAMVGSLSSSNLLGAGGATGSVQGASLTSVAVHYITLAITDSALMADFDTGFRPGVDDWEFGNTRTQLDTSGAGVGAGMAATAVWYFATRPSGARLSKRFAEAAGVEFSDRRGLRWVSEVTKTIGPVVLASVQQTLTALGGNDPVDADYNQFLSVRAAFALGQGAPQPQLISVEPVGESYVIAPMIVYKAIGGALYVADYSLPGDASRTLNFTASGGMQPYVASGASYNRPISMGLSSLLPLAALSTSYPSMVDGTIGASDFFPYTLHSKYGVLGDTIWVPDTLRVWAECPACTPVTTSSSAPEATASLAGLDVWTLSGSTWAHQGAATVLGFNQGAVAAPSVATQGFVVEQQGPVASDSADIYWMDWKQVTVVKTADSILAAVLTPVGQSPSFNFTQQTNGLLPPHVNYHWDFNDGTAAVTVNDNPTVQHTFATPGTYTITGQVLDRTTNQPLAETTVVDSVKSPLFVWQFNSATVTSAVVPTLYGRSDSVKFDKISTILANMHSAPGNTVLFKQDSSDCGVVGLEQFPAGQVVTTAFAKSALVNVLGIHCTGSDSTFELGTLAMGALGSGPLTGSATQVGGGLVVLLSNNVTSGSGLGSINAVMNGSTLTGSFIWAVDYGFGRWQYTVQFQAQLVSPPLTSPSGSLRRRP